MVSTLLVDDERVAVERDERGREHRPHELPHGGAERAVAAGERVAELARHPLCAERLGAGDAGGVEHERGAQRAASWAMPRSGSGSASARSSSASTIASMLARLVAAGVADGLLALGVGPAGAVGDQLAVVADEQVADDLPERVRAGRRVGSISPARMSCPSPRLLRVASAWRARACARRCSSSAAASRSSSSSRRAPAK